jgi:hypothetical protein
MPMEFDKWVFILFLPMLCIPLLFFILKLYKAFLGRLVEQIVDVNNRPVRSKKIARTSRIIVEAFFICIIFLNSLIVFSLPLHFFWNIQWTLLFKILFWSLVVLSWVCTIMITRKFIKHLRKYLDLYEMGLQQKNNVQW